MISGTQKKTRALSIYPLLTRLIIVMLLVLGGILSFVIYQESKLDLQNTLNILEQEGFRLIYQIESYEGLLSYLGEGNRDSERALEEELLALLASEDHLFYIQIVNSEGLELLNAGTPSPITPDCYDHLMTSLQTARKITHTYKDHQTRNLIYEIIEPITMGGEPIGALRLGLLLDEVRSRISFTRTSHFYNLAIFIITAIIIGIIAFYLIIARNNFLLTTNALKAAEENNRIIMEKMKQSERLSALGEFSAGIAHEIKNPLASIKNFTQLLPSEYEDPHFRREFTELVTREVNRINKIVNDLLDYARPRRVDRTMTKLPELIDETLFSLKGTLDEHRITVKKNYGQLPLIAVDHEQMRQVLLNLILNAVEAMPGGGTITVSARKNEENEITIILADTGCGIPQELLKDIFNPFFTTKERGTGLGLSIVQRIVNEQGGRIDVESRKDQGTQFTIVLPREPKRDEKDTDRR